MKRKRLATAQIEGEQLQLNSVCASAARRLGLADGSGAPRDARTEATLDVLQAAVSRWQQPLTEEDLFGWHAALFPTGRSGVTRITTGGWHTHAELMQIVTPGIGKPDVVHWEASYARCSNGSTPTAACRRSMAWSVRRSCICGSGHSPIRGRQRPHRPRAGGAGAGAGHAQRPAPVQPFSAAGSSWKITPWVQWFVGRIQAAFDAATGHMQKALAHSRYRAEGGGRGTGWRWFEVGLGTNEYLGHS